MDDSMVEDNPWYVNGIDAFNFLCCPECVYRCKEENSFQSHAIWNHPKSKVLFSYKQGSEVNRTLRNKTHLKDISKGVIEPNQTFPHMILLTVPK